MKDQLKILLTIPNFDTAGSGKVVYDLAKGLKERGHNVSIACNHNKGNFFKEIESLNIPIYIKNMSVSLRPYFTLLQRIAPISRFIGDNNFDLVHSWNWSSDWTEIIATRKAGSKYIFTKKSMSWGNKHWKIKCLLSNFVITVNFDLHHLISRKKKKKLIPFGLDTNYFKTVRITSKNDLSFTICTIANLVKVKNIEAIINAIKILKVDNINLRIVGDHTTNYYDVLQNLVNDYGLNNQVQFVGKIMDVREELAAADLYIISSLEEGMPMALVEAMSMGTPVLGSNVSGIDYVLRDFQDYLFDLDNEDELPEKIMKIYKMSVPQRKVIGDTLRNYCIENYSLPQFIDNYESLYLNIVNGE